MTSTRVKTDSHSEPTIAASETEPNYRDFPFPLNAYAHTLLLEEGRVDYLHYGLFDPGETDLVRAQQRSTDLLLSNLPAPPCRILKVGIGLGTTLEQLCQLGYAVTGITPNPIQVAHAKHRLGTAARLVCSRFGDFAPKGSQYEVILFQESSQDIDPLDLFERARDMLTEGGRMLLLDNMAIRRTEPGTANLHLLDGILALADRCGFELESRLDLSAMAAPTLDYLLMAVEKQRSNLMRDLALGPEQIDSLNASNREYQSDYAHDRHGYFLLSFRRREAFRWRLGWIGERHLPQVQSLFREVFGQDLSPALWAWKYGPGKGEALGVWRENKLVAHYGGLPRDIHLFGQRRKAVQIGDVMVAPTERGVLTRKGPFFLSAATYLEQRIGYDTPHLLGFGFPNERHMRLAERLGLYGEVDRLVEMTWPSVPCRRSLLTRVRPLRRNEQDWAAIDRLWTEMAADLAGAIVGVRDAAHILHRYLQHPEKQYQVMLVLNRLSNRPHGLIVLRREGERSELMDVVGPLRAIPLLIATARKMAGCSGAKTLFCWITASHCAWFQAAGGTVQALDIRIPSSVWTPGPSIAELQGKWWLMSGDTDFR